jgi:hypothetical protein
MPLPVRTIPAWIQDAEEEDLKHINPAFLEGPDAAILARHHHNSNNHQQPRTSRWLSFAQPSAYPREKFDGERVDSEWLNSNWTDYSQPWLANHHDDDEDDGFSRYRAFRRKRQAWYKRAQYTILRNPFIPLAFRVTVLTFAVAAIALGITIYHRTNHISNCIRTRPGDRSPACVALVGTNEVDYYRDPSALMAIIVDVVAVVYTGYITYDEYFSKPLGLRNAKAKIRLVLLDLFFIVFQSANLSLSFESLTVDEGACVIGDDAYTVRFDDVCARQRALSAVLLVSLVAWMMTFSVSCLR